MNTIQRFVRQVLFSLPQELLAATWRILLLILILLLYLLKLLIDLFRSRRKKPKDPCNKVPEIVKRKPDPCLYSQYYRLSQGLSVTWNNPDIWITTPGGEVVDSRALQADTDYVVHARIHNASFDASLATQVRCFYRPWSFNSPDTIPIETNPDGTEKIALLHIGAWSNEIAQFNWHTPATAAHYCIRVACYQPDDKNPNNNLGQENTNVIEAEPGESVSAVASLYNNADETRNFRIFTDGFAVPKGKVELQLQTYRQPLRRKRSFEGLHRAMLRVDPKKGRLSTESRFEPSLIRYKYTGWEKITASFQRGNFPFATGWQLTLNGRPAEEWTTVEIPANSHMEIELSATLPPATPRGSITPFNFTAVDPSGKLMGGVTLEIIAQ